MQQSPGKVDKKSGKHKKDKKEKPQPEEEMPVSPSGMNDDDDDDDDEDDADNDEEETDESDKNAAVKNNPPGRDDSSDDDLWTDKFTKSKEQATASQAAKDLPVLKDQVGSIEPDVIQSLPKVSPPCPWMFLQSYVHACPWFISFPARPEHEELRSDTQLIYALLLREQMLSMTTVVDCCSLEGSVSLGTSVG